MTPAQRAAINQAVAALRAAGIRSEVTAIYGGSIELIITLPNIKREDYERSIDSLQRADSPAKAG
jgi:hypothetical protein